MGRNILVKSALLSAVLLTLFLFQSCNGNGAKGNSAQRSMAILQVEGYRVSPGPFNNHVTATAELLAAEKVEIMAPLSGQVLEIFFNEGRKINKDEAIIRMDDRNWKAQLIGLKAELDVTAKDYERKKSLLEIEGSSQEEVDETWSTMESLKSQIQQLQLNIDLANVKAPFSGWLGMRNFSKGAYLKEGEIITVLTDMNKLKVDFELAQEYKSSIKAGKKIAVVVEKDTLGAVIYAVDPVINSSSRTIHARAILQQTSEGTILPGTFAEIIVETNFIEDALMVPSQSIVPEINDQTVFVYHHGKAFRKTIEMGNRTDDKVHVKNGISAGDTIITTGLLMIKNDMPVNLQSVQH